MAFTTKSSVVKAATVLLLIIAASTVSPASASTMWAYRRGCRGHFISFSCGCHNLAGYKGGFIFKYSGGWFGKFYHGSDCSGPHVSVGRHVRHCSAHHYNSVYIPC